MDALAYHAEQIQVAAAAFGPFHEQAATNWLESSLSGGGSCTKTLRAALHEHDALLQECVISADGTVDPRCLEICRALDALQRKLEEQHTQSATDEFPTDAREWIECVLLAEEPTPESLKEQRAILFSDCVLGELGGPSKCEVLQLAFAEYYQLVASVR